jgi:selenocysteine lyase/cysteine desulfurase
MAFYAIPFKAGDRILTSVAEYASNYIAFLQIARKSGVQVDVVPNDEHGQLSLQALEAMIDERVRLIAISHVPSTGGLVQPAAGVGRIARAHNILYLLDACQSVGQMEIDVREIGCHMLSATGRKYLRGPRGIGFLYVERAITEMLEPPLLDLHAATWVAKDRYELRPDALRFENWEANIAAKVGLGVAVEYALGWGIGAIEQRVTELAAQFRTQLAAVQGVTVRDLGQRRCGIVTFDAASRTPQQIKAFLAAERINVSISPVEYSLLDLGERGLANLVRASVHYYNTGAELERFCDVLRANL